jgi:hypothetical protein
LILRLSLSNLGIMLSKPLPYHLKIRDYFKGQTRVWSFFANSGKREKEALTIHEQARLQLYALENGELGITGRIMTAIGESAVSEAVYIETARLFRLYTEVWCDKVIYDETGDTGPVISLLESLEEGSPEKAIRLQALTLWKEQGEAAIPLITSLIEGTPELDRMDVMAKLQLSALTRELLQYYLSPPWLRTPPVMALAKEYFADLLPEKEGAAEEIRAFLAVVHMSIREYFAYVLLDFALVDPALGNTPVEHARRLAETIGLSDIFEPILIRHHYVNE